MKRLAAIVFAAGFLFSNCSAKAEEPKQAEERIDETELNLEGMIISPNDKQKEISAKIDAEYTAKRSSVNKVYPFSECSSQDFIDIDKYKKFAEDYVAKSGRKPKKVLDRLYNLAFDETIKAYKEKEIDKERAIEDITNELIRNARIFSWKYRSQKKWKPITKIKELDKRTQPIIAVMIYGNLPIALAEVYNTAKYIKGENYKEMYRAIFLNQMTLLRFNRKHNIRMEKQPNSLPEYMTNLASNELRRELFAMIVEQLIDEGSYRKNSNEKIQ